MRDNETRFAELRLDKNLKQKDLAKMLNISEDRYSKYERRINDLTLEMSNKIANFYDVSLDYLFGISNKKFTGKKSKIDLTLLPKRLLELRKEKKLNQSELGQKVGFVQTTYSGYENGTSIPTSFKTYYLAIYYHVSMDYLVGRVDIKEIQQKN